MPKPRPTPACSWQNSGMLPLFFSGPGPPWQGWPCVLLFLVILAQQVFPKSEQRGNVCPLTMLYAKDEQPEVPSL